jgi:hypothetical protein
LPPVVAGGNEEEVVGAAVVGAEEDDNGEDGDDDGGDDDVVPEVVVSVAPAPPFCVKSIVRRTGWHISSAELTTVADAHNSKLLTLPGIVTLIGSIMGASFPRTRLTSMPIFLVERFVLVAEDVVVVGPALSLLPPPCIGDENGVVVPDVGGGVVVVPGVVAVVVPSPPPPVPAPSSPILNVNVSGLVLAPVIVALWSVVEADVVVAVVPVSPIVVVVVCCCCWAIANDGRDPAKNKIPANKKAIEPRNINQLTDTYT